jgi:hypothetical protein
MNSVYDKIMVALPMPKKRSVNVAKKLGMYNGMVSKKLGMYNMQNKKKLGKYN